MEKQCINGPMLKRMFINAAKTLDNNRSIVDSLNVFPVPDGDTGTNMSLTMLAAVEELQRLKTETVSGVAEAVASGSLMGARGNSGVILSQLFRGFSKRLKEETRIDTKAFAEALMKGVETAYKAVMKPIEGTILTVARETAEKAMDICHNIKDFDLFLEEMIKQSTATLEKTPKMLKVLSQAGVVDAGGKGFVYILLGFLKAVRGEEIELNGSNRLMKVVQGEQVGLEDLKYPYCTEFIIKFPASSADELREVLFPLGDSALVVGDESAIKVHIHTDKPHRVIEEGLKLGELSGIKIDNMKEQHRSIIDPQEPEKKEVELEKRYGIISVVMGEGFANIFRDLGADVIIEGGQTMNPSTQDILKAVEELKASSIFILPNNSNIILAANQAKQLSSKEVFVIPSKTMPQGISAMITFNAMQGETDNFNNMVKALNSVKTGQVTYAVRDSVFDGIQIDKGDIMGIGDGHICNKGNSIPEVAFQLVSSLIDEESELVTIFYGEEIEEGEAQALADKIRECNEHCEVEVHYGGQPIYYYIFAVE